MRKANRIGIERYIKILILLSRYFDHTEFKNRRRKFDGYREAFDWSVGYAN